MRLEDYVRYEPLRTGFFTFDNYLGGITRGNLHQFSGRENSGKTTLLQNLIGSIQKQAPEFRIKYFDTEGNFDPAYAQACGVVGDNFEFSVQNDIVEVLEESLDFIKQNNKEQVPSLIAVDSYAGFTHEDEMEKGISKDTRQVQVRKLNIFLRLVVVPLKQQGSVILFTNQLRDKVQSMWGGTDTPGGHHLKHATSLHLNLYDLPNKAIQISGKSIGHEVSFTVEKIKSMDSYRGFSFNLPLIFGRGFSAELDLLRNGVDLGVIQKRGSWYEINGQKFQGEASVYEEMINNQDFFEEIKSSIL